MLKNFKLKLSGDGFWQSKTKLGEVLSLRRKIHSFEFSNVSGCHDALTRIVSRFGVNLRSLTIADAKVDDFTLREVLKGAEQLESLVLAEVKVVKKLPAINPVNMYKLKALKIIHCDWGIVKFMNCLVSTLELKSYLDEGARAPMISFLANQYKLKALTLRGTSARSLFQQDDLVGDCSFCLEMFHLEQDFGKNSDNVNWHCTMFLSLHVDSLKDVEISGPNQSNISGFVISNLEKLRSLSIDVRGLPKDLEFYEMLEEHPNYVLKELSLRGFFIHPTAIRRIIQKYPAIEKLELNDWGQGQVATDMLDFISLNFPKLKKLSVTEMSSSTCVKFSCLKNLSVTYIRSTAKLVQFMVHNPSVETLKIGLVYIGQVTSSFIEQLKCLDNVKHIGFGGCGSALKLVHDNMKTENPPENLKTLELSLISNENSALRSGKILKFYFPIKESSKFEIF